MIDIDKIIKRKIEEHKEEVDYTEEKIKKLGKNPNELPKLMVLKDKIIFHKACAACLQDLLGELKC